MKPPVVVARANDVSFLGHLRTCGDHGVDPISVTHNWEGAPTWYSSHSKWFQEEVELDNPVGNDSSYVEGLRNLGIRLRDETGEVPFCIPSSDTNLEVFLRHEEKFRGVFRLIGSRDWSQFPVRLTDKIHCSEVLGASLPNHVPKCGIFEPGLDLDQFRFPVIVKPRRKDYSQSFYKRHKGLKALKLMTLDEAAQELAEVSAGENLLVQEYIPFESKYSEIPFYAYADKDSNLRMAATGIKEFIQPAPYGTATVLRLTHHEELTELAKKIAKALSWRGPLMIEFIKDFQDGHWKIIEINTRPWLFHRFYTRHGLDFVGMFLRDLNGDLDQSNEILTPGVDLVGTDGLQGPLHIDVEQVFQYHLDKIGKAGDILLSEVGGFIRGFAGDWSIPQYEAGDPAPGEVHSEMLSQRFDFHVRDFESEIERSGFWM